MTNFFEKLKQEKILVSDGAMGSLLFEKGLNPGDCPERFNLEHPKVLAEIAQAYLQAGADIIQTNTFGASPLKLSDYNLDDKTKEINQKAVEIVKQVVDSKAFVSGSIGPTGKMLIPYGDIEPASMKDNYKKQSRALIESGVDLLCIETMTDLNEALIAIQSAREISLEIPIIATMTFDVIPQGCVTIMGNGVAEVCTKLQEFGANVIGSNCGNGTKNMITIAKEFLSNTELPIIIQSNAGIPTIVDDHVVYQETPEEFADFTKILLELGVSIIGGCCGTTPDHIKAIKQAVDAIMAS
ncbi:MAG: homocysteine S-methyltransferase family protein [Candidatus Marinimicrobia bacterium]|nr:homocysteine S-methyltransferase family protein [Candidatus Neomarinimicrobiota bacterium]